MDTNQARTKELSYLEEGGGGRGHDSWEINPIARNEKYKIFFKGISFVSNALRGLT